MDEDSLPFFVSRLENGLFRTSKRVTCKSQFTEDAHFPMPSVEWLQDRLATCPEVQCQYDYQSIHFSPSHRSAPKAQCFNLSYLETCLFAYGPKNFEQGRSTLRAPYSKMMRFRQRDCKSNPNLDAHSELTSKKCLSLAELPVSTPAKKASIHFNNISNGLLRHCQNTSPSYASNPNSVLASCYWQSRGKNPLNYLPAQLHRLQTSL